ncbi:MAG: zinc dependent phospholipase C family protein [Eubacteriales bacterium]|nr:zinc dependent phospholipase C family protein [Eubacteriales bacterium]
MAYLLAHTLFGSRVLDRLNTKIDNQANFYLGCVGPDMFFFDRTPPPLFRKNQKILGNLLHHESGSQLLKAFLDCRCEHEGQNSFLYGMLCHLALDAAVHPYIESQYSHLDHTRFEVLIDMQLYREQSEQIGRPSQKQLGADYKSAGAYMASVIELLYFKDLPKAYQRSYRKFVFIHKLLFDPKGRKLRFAQRIDKLIGKENCTAGFILSVNLPDRYDSRNLEHREWAAPWKKDVKRHESFDELFDEGVENAVRWIDALEAGQTDAVMEELSHIAMNKGVLD